MRLTLRTLLAYLDDMLDPAETRAIGQKVAESDTAQDLIARIKQVTRRRRLTTPPTTGPGSFEPNSVAEYLDNTLPNDQVADLEKACLESDVHLAEIAAVHQILTLVLGQPALVPPTAKQRMYGLVRGREAIPSRRPARTARDNVRPVTDDGYDDEETFLGLPFQRRQAGWMRWLLPVSALLLIAVLGVALWQVFPSPAPTTVAQAPEPKTPIPQGGGNGGGEPNKSGANPDTNSSAKPPEEGKTGDSDKGNLPGTSGGTDKLTPDGKTGDVHPTPTTPFGKPSLTPDRRVVGHHVNPGPMGPTALTQRTAKEQPWVRVAPDTKVHTRDLLVSLPGFRSELHLDRGVSVHLWGNVPEYFGIPFYECGIILNTPTEGFDAEITLDRGAVLLTNRREREGDLVRVRLRFQEEMWDLTLSQPGTQLGVTLWGRQSAPYNSGEAPSAELALLVLRGRATVKTHMGEYRDLMGNNQTPTAFIWDNKSREAQGPIPARDPLLEAIATLFGRIPTTAQAKDMRAGLEGLAARLNRPQPLETILAEVLQGTDTIHPAQRLLAIRSLAALDNIGDLFNVLEDGTKPPPLRTEAIYALRHWLGREEPQERRLYDTKSREGLLASRKYRPGESEMILSLLHPFSEAQRSDPETYAWLIDQIRHERLSIRELTYWHLTRMAPAGRAIPYDAADSAEQRERAHGDWKRLIPDGKLPPPPGMR